jgi:hypothetical protein
MSLEASIGIGSCALIGAGLLLRGVYQRRKLLASASWPQVTGTIIKSELR